MRPGHRGGTTRAHPSMAAVGSKLTLVLFGSACETTSKHRLGHDGTATAHPDPLQLS